MYIFKARQKKGVGDLNFVETLSHTDRGRNTTTASWTGLYLCLCSRLAISHVTPILNLKRRLTFFP